MASSGTPFEPNPARWDPWRPAEVAARLARVEAPWYVAAGWAIDLFLGEERRPHDDIEVAVPRDRFAEFLPALDGFELFAVGSGLAYPLSVEALEATHQTWVREPGSEKWRLDVFREPSDGDRWICRRDPRIRLPYVDVIAYTSDRIPFARPEIVLLFKAKAARAKDEDDFAAVLPRLDGERREWLADAIELVEPGHRWLAELR